MKFEQGGAVPACLLSLLSACSGQSGPSGGAASGAASGSVVMGSGQIATGGYGDSDAQAAASTGQIETDAGATNQFDGVADETSVAEDAIGKAAPDGDGAVRPVGDAGSGYDGTDKLVCAPGPDGNGMHDETAALQTDPPEWKLMAGARAGTLTASVSFLSKIYGQHFPYRVYASANVVKGKPAVFMTFGDGSEYIGGFHTPTVLDNLTASGDVPPTVALFIDPPSDGDRVKTYDPPTDKYSRFLLTEITPAVIDPTYTISKDPAAWATGGHSASGEQDWTVLWTTDKFHKFLGHNSSFGAAPTYGVDWAKTIMMAPRRDLRVSLVVAAVGKDLVDQRGDWTKINEGVATALAAKGDDYRLIIGPGTHGGPASQRDFPTALRWAFRNCKFAM
jgi:enterochelin esterase-like enzyme